MDSGSDGEDYVYYGTPLEDEKPLTRGFFKAPQDPRKTRTLPVWEQEVTDQDGRKRFHGAFTGGYSAGFYNSVGSKVRTMMRMILGSGSSGRELEREEYKTSSSTSLAVCRRSSCGNQN